MTTKMDIDGGKLFDLLEDGDFYATSAEFDVGGNVVHFEGVWIEPGGSKDAGAPATLQVLSAQDLTEDNYLSTPWDDYMIVWHLE